MTLTNLRGRRSRDALISELLDEMSSWSARDRMLAFRSWMKGSLSLIHLSVLTILESDGPLPMSRLGEMLDVSVASTSGIIGRMEERGLVERTHDAADRRVVLVRLTTAGTAVFRDMTEHRRQHLGALFERLSHDELAALLTGLRAMRKARISLHLEHANDGLVAVTVQRPDEAAAPVITGDKE